MSTMLKNQKITKDYRRVVIEAINQLEQHCYLFFVKKREVLLR